MTILRQRMIEDMRVPEQRPQPLLTRAAAARPGRPPRPSRFSTGRPTCYLGLDAVALPDRSRARGFIEPCLLTPAPGGPLSTPPLEMGRCRL